MQFDKKADLVVSKKTNKGQKKYLLFNTR